MGLLVIKGHHDLFLDRRFGQGTAAVVVLAVVVVEEEQEEKEGHREVCDKWCAGSSVTLDSTIHLKKSSEHWPR